VLALQRPETARNGPDSAGAPIATVASQCPSKLIPWQRRGLPREAHGAALEPEAATALPNMSPRSVRGPLGFGGCRLRIDRMGRVRIDGSLRVEHKPTAGFVDDGFGLAASQAQVPVDEDEAMASKLGRRCLTSDQCHVAVVSQRQHAALAEQEHAALMGCWHATL